MLDRYAEGFDQIVGVQWLLDEKQKGVDLGHRPVDPPAGAHLAPVKHEFLLHGREFHRYSSGQ